MFLCWLWLLFVKFWRFNFLKFLENPEIQGGGWKMAAIWQSQPNFLRHMTSLFYDANLKGDIFGRVIHPPRITTIAFKLHSQRKARVSTLIILFKYFPFQTTDLVNAVQMCISQNKNKNNKTA